MRKRLVCGGKVIVAIAATWAVGASLYIFSSPVSVHGVKEALLRGDRIELRGFGVFQVKDRKRGIGRNPKTGHEVEIPPGKTIRFKPGKALRNMS